MPVCRTGCGWARSEEDFRACPLSLHNRHRLHSLDGQQWVVYARGMRGHACGDHRARPSCASRPQAVNCLTVARTLERRVATSLRAFAGRLLDSVYEIPRASRATAPRKLAHSRTGRARHEHGAPLAARKVASARVVPSTVWPRASPRAVTTRSRQNRASARFLTSSDSRVPKPCD